MNLITRRKFLEASAGLGGLLLNLPARTFYREFRASADVPLSGHLWLYASKFPPDWDATPILEQVFQDFKYAGLEGIQVMESILRHDDMVEQAGALIEKYDVPITGSISETKFGNRLTDQFFYTQGDRLKLEKGEYNIKSVPQKLRFNIILKEGITSDDISSAFHEGIRIDDISDVFTPPKEEINNFADTEERSLPVAMTIEYEGLDNMDLVIIGFYQKRIEDGQMLLQYERDRYGALMMVYKPEQIDGQFEQEYIHSNDGESRLSVLYEKCNIKFDSGHVEEITEEHQRLIEWNNIVRRELRKVGIASKKELAQYYWLYNFLMERGIQFDPEIVLFSKTVIYLDYVSWLHIFLKHAKPLMVGKHVRSRTPFQYALKDIIILLKHIINQIQDAIETHFKQKGSVEFTKRGIYFQGDYYTVKISGTGRIETIYKQEK